ncbi:MAG: hypothetical protein AB1779_05655 [Candidatus Thermoplasmatota archaeon]
MGKMIYIGKIEKEGKKGSLVVKSCSPIQIKIGDKLFNKKKVIIGKISHIFGPTNAPYISFFPKSKGNIDSMVGMEVYKGEEYEKRKSSR